MLITTRIELRVRGGVVEVDTCRGAGDSEGLFKSALSPIRLVLYTAPNAPASS